MKIKKVVPIEDISLHNLMNATATMSGVAAYREAFLTWKSPSFYRLIHAIRTGTSTACAHLLAFTGDMLAEASQ